MTQDTPTIEQASGEPGLQVHKGLALEVRAGVPNTIGSFMTPFEENEDLLVGRPVKRPRRLQRNPQPPPIESLSRRCDESDKSWMSDWMSDTVDPTEPDAP